MKLVKTLLVVMLIMFAASVARADDTKVNLNGGPGGSPACGSNSANANDAGVLSADCVVTSATGAITTFSFEVLDANTIGGGLTCASDLTSIDGWSGTLTAHNIGGIDICTVTAPTTVSLQTYWNLLLTGDPYLGGPTLSTFHNDGDCDLDDFVLGIPVGCDIKIDSADGSVGQFVGGAPVGFAVNGNNLPSLPEPGTLALLAIGLTGLPLLRRKFAR
ncbi:MAG: PEP-CTERM sorting domain-containing protein [Candidatus Acidiferrales bacterium]